MARHLATSRIDTYLTAVALEDVRNSGTPAPQAVDEAGRSAQQFVVDVVVRRGEEKRRISAAGRDIYAVTAPLVAEAARRLTDGRATVSPGRSALPGLAGWTERRRRRAGPRGHCWSRPAATNAR
jgi:hypothetical protein